MTDHSVSLSLDAFLREVNGRISELRRRLQVETSQKVRTLQDAWKLSGRVYVSSIGTVVEVVNHETEFFYIPVILPTRDRVLNALGKSRQRIYDGIADQLGEPKRVLAIGAGGDVAPLWSMRSRSHEVVATDFAEDVVDVLRKKANVPAFACDLIYLDEVLPEPVDVIIANATLGYIAPSKLAKVVRNITEAMNVGGVFTFDLKPHGDYFNMALGTTQQTVANESAPSPRILLELVRKHGQARGIAAATLQAYLTGIAVNLAIVDVLRRQFEAEGLRCSTGQYVLESAQGSKIQSLILRVCRVDESLLAPVQGETQYVDPLDALRHQELVDLDYLPFFLDRGIGEELAKEFGIHHGWREDPWLVLAYLERHPADPSYYAALLPEVKEVLHPVTLADRILEYVNGRSYVPPTPLPAAVLVDQNTRKMAITSGGAMGEEAADARIDLAYHRASANPSLSAEELGRPPTSPSTPKVGRNDPCPCGSGRKYKKCHGA